MRKIVIILGILALIVTSGCGQKKPIKDGETYFIWQRVEYRNEKGETEHYGLSIDTALIKSFPEPVKIIVAYYSTFIPYFLFGETLLEDGTWADDKLLLARALGDFETLETAQATLSSFFTARFPNYPNSRLEELILGPAKRQDKWTPIIVKGEALTSQYGYDNTEELFGDGLSFPGELRLIKTKQSYFFTHTPMYGGAIGRGGYIENEFEIDKNGSITFIYKTIIRKGKRNSR